MIGEAATFLLECMRMLAQREPAMFLLSLAAAIALGALSWWACTHYTRLWNLGFHATFTHHALCAAAALLTLAFALVFFSLSQAKEVARIKIAAWHRDIRADIAFSQTLYATAYHNTRQAGLETFDPNRHFPPGHPKSLMPLSHEKTRIETSKLYGDAACANFQRRHPFLARILWPSGAIPLDVIIADMRGWFARNPSGTYQLHRGIDLAAEQINKALEPNTPRVVSTARRYALFLFLLVQAIPFSLIGYAAYRDLKEVT